VHSVEHIYLRQRCFDASKPCVAASTGAQYLYVGFSRRRPNKIPHCSAYAMGESNPVPAIGLWSGSGSNVHQFADICRHDTFHPNPCTRFRVGLILHTDRQTNRQTNAGARSKTYTSSVVGGKLLIATNVGFRFLEFMIKFTYSHISSEQQITSILLASLNWLVSERNIHYKVSLNLSQSIWLS